MALLLALWAGTAPAQQVKPSCTDSTRACMIAAATSYLEGIVHHDGAKVLFAPDVRRTEQGHDTGRGEAALRAALQKMPPMLGYRNTRFVTDEKTHQLVYFTLLQLENGFGKPGSPVTVHLAERFRVDQGLITEIEALFYPQSGTSDGESGWPDLRSQ
jgi:hypothetical protein